jgi:hypothetical protein
MKDVYIATYSAHASIIEDVVGEDGIIKKLLIDAGGLLMPNGSFSNKNLFDNYVPITDKTLHAKIILKDYGNKALLSLWTGNLRKATLDDCNLFFNLSVSPNEKPKLIKWFNGKAPKNIFFYADKSGKNVEITSSTKSFWSVLVKSMPSTFDGHIYAFSPWGSNKFVDEISKRSKKISIYTQYGACLWASYALTKDDHDVNVYRSKIGSPFPHFKAIFITNSVGDLIWSYIGSANFTKQAMFGKKNIEYGLIFPSKQSCRSLTSLFEKITKKSFGWEFVQQSKQKISRDFTDDDFDDNHTNFRFRQCIHRLMSNESFSEAKLETIYKKGSIQKIGKYRVEVTDINDNTFFLLIQDGAESWKIEIPRIKIKYHSILSNKKIESLVDTIVTKPANGNVGIKKWEKNEKHPVYKDTSILIHMEDLLRDAEYRNRVKDALEELDKAKCSIDNKNFRDLLSIWKPVVDKL